MVRSRRVVLLRRPKRNCSPVFRLIRWNKVVLTLCRRALRGWLEERWLGERFGYGPAARPSLGAAGERKGMFCCVRCTERFRHGRCWAPPLTAWTAPRCVDSFIRCLTKDKNQHNKTSKYLVLIMLCGYSVNILMQNVSEQCLRTTRQCEIHVW